MIEGSYWYIAVAPLSIPYWTEVTTCEMEFGGDTVVAPMLFTTRDKAAAELREWDEGAADAYLRLVEECTESMVNRALDNTPGLSVYEIDRWLLGEHLGDSDLVYVILDNEVSYAWALADELKRQGE